MWGICHSEKKYKKFGFFSIANQVLSYFQYIFAHCFTLKLRKIKRKDEKIKQEAQRATYRAPEYNVPPFWRIGQGSHLFFLIGPKNTNLVEDVEILLSVKFL